MLPVAPATRATRHRASLLSAERPAASYDEALARAEMLRARDDGPLHPDGAMQLLTHGRTVERAIVLHHGYTNGPQQFVALGRLLHEQGANVLIPRLPYHGLADRLTPALAWLTAGDMAALASEAVDIARGLGRQVTVAGLSAGGVMAAWVAQFRGDVARAVAIAPEFGLHVVPVGLAGPMRVLLGRLPNRFVWWDPRLGERIPGPPHAYPRFSTHSLAETLRLGAFVRRAAGRGAPACPEIAVLTNRADTAVSRAATSSVVDAWRRHGARGLRWYEFAPALKLLHDLIDPTQPGQQTDLVYPVLAELITTGRLTPSDGLLRLLEVERGAESASSI
jgi:hypothetical protein